MNRRRPLTRARRGMTRQWFLFTLAAVLLIGASGYARLIPLSEAIPRNLLVAGIMLLMSAPLDLRRSLSGRGAWLAVAVAVATNALLAGPLAWLVGRWLPETLSVGLVVAALAPCTLASAAVWTRRGGGNEAIALMVTVVTNLGCFLTIPLWAWLLLGRGRSVDPAALALRLLLIVVVPIVLGQVLRYATPIRLWCDDRRKGLSLAAQFGLLGMVFIGAVRCGELLADGSAELTTLDWIGLVAATGAVHCGLFWIAWTVVRCWGGPLGEALPAGVAGSQKTLAVGLDVALGFGGLAVLPMVVYHALQLLIDAVLVDRLGPGDASADDPAPVSALEEEDPEA